MSSDKTAALNKQITTNREQIVDELYARIGSKNDILNPDCEFTDNYLECWELSNTLAFHLSDESISKQKIATGLYRGMTFAKQTLRYIKHDVDISRIRDIFDDTGDDSIVSRVNELQQDYLSLNPDIDNLISDFMPELDAPDYQTDDFVEIGAVLVFMVSDTTTKA